MDSFVEHYKNARPIFQLKTIPNRNSLSQPAQRKSEIFSQHIPKIKWLEAIRQAHQNKN